MINFLKKQFIKILIYGFILLVAICFINHFNLSATNISIIITTINSIFIIFIGKSWIEDYKIENSKELENYKTIKNKELKSYQENIDKSLKDYQSENDEKLEEFKAIQTKELETHKSKLSGYTLVTKLQFELEFKIYKEVYANLYILYIETDKLINSIKYFNSKESEMFGKQLIKFYSLYEKASLLILRNKPFYSNKIYDFLIKLRNLCYSEAKSVERLLKKTNKIKSLNPYETFDLYKFFDEDKYIDKRHEIKETLDKISILISERITAMRIIED